MPDEMLGREDQGTDDPQSARALRALGRFMLLGVAIDIVFSLQHGVASSNLVSLATALGISGTAAVLGALLGFLFGIPRTLQRTEEEAVATSQQGSVPASGVSYRPNTNLEQISDWLTKIIVGIGLIQVNEVPAVLRRFADFVAPGFGNAAGSRVFAVLILLYFLVAGFLLGYLWTRLYLAGAMRTADIASLGRKFDVVERKLDELQTKGEMDAHALTLAQRQLEPSKDEPEVPQAQLNEAISSASIPARATIFRQARKVRRDNWKHNSDKAKMERAMPIFRALIDASPFFHRDHGQLGYCFKDQRVPDYAAAKEYLTKAIKLRGPWQENGYVIYELNRALCDIYREREEGVSGPSPEDVRNSVLEDLRVAKEGGLADVLSESIFRDWLKRNQIETLDRPANPTARADG